MLSNILKIRLLVITISFLSLFIVLLGHIFLIQIPKRSFFSSLGHQQYHVTLKTLPPRAPIYDIDGKLIATEKPITSIFITPNNIKNKEETINFLQRYYPQSLEKYNKNQQSLFMYVARNISPEEVELISQQKLDDIYILEEPGRYYPIAALAPVIGKTDIDNHGISGLELLYNRELAGTQTTTFLEKDARSGKYYFNKQTVTEGTAGEVLYTTIDSTLQFLAAEELQETIDKFHAKEGAVIILNPTTGEIYAMVTLPTIDPNNAKLDDVSLLKNRVVTETYELGSVMKTFLALAALEEKLYTPEDFIDCENRKVGYVNGMKLNTWKEHGELTLSQVIEYSNNIGTAKVAQKVGTKLYDHYTRCGFGQPTGFTFPGQQRGHVTHPKTWSKASLNSLSFGYEVRATLLQLARAISIFTNGGYLPTPSLLYNNHKKQENITPLYSAETIEQMRTILEKTCTQGTAHAAVIPGVTVLGKTGTARLLDETGHYSPLKNIYTFAGIIEKGDYKRVIVTFVKEASRHDIYASTVAAPLFERIAQKMLIRDNH